MLFGLVKITMLNYLLMEYQKAQKIFQMQNYIGNILVNPMEHLLFMVKLTSCEFGMMQELQQKLNQICSVAGGGDTVSLLNSMGIFNNFNFVSTAGGAFLEYLEGKQLPGIKALSQ